MEEAQAINNPEFQKLVSELGLENLPQDKQQELLTKMTEVLLKRIFIETMDKLDEQGREEYEKMLDGEVQPEQVEEFFKSRIKDYDQMVQQVIDEFKAEMLSAGQKSEGEAAQYLQENAMDSSGQA